MSLVVYSEYHLSLLYILKFVFKYEYDAIFNKPNIFFYLSSFFFSKIILIIFKTSSISRGFNRQI